LDKRKFLTRVLSRSLLFVILNFCLFAKTEIFSSIRFWYPSPSIIKTIQDSGIALDHSIMRSGAYLDLVVSQQEKLILEGLDLFFEVLIDDLTSYYKDRNVEVLNERNFPLGSMLGNYTWSELNQRHEELKNMYPEIISEKIILGQSVEGNDIWAFKLSDNVNEDEDEPEVLYTGLTHSREPLSMMNLFYFVQNLIESYDIDSSEANYLINERELWFIPVVNPDGYIYNEEIEPDGGGMHRKNRRDTGCGLGTQRGVDLNRNYGFGWGANDTGSSPDPCSAIYRGESAFSEPEIEIVKDFILNRNFKNVLHYHSFGNVYIHPFGDGSYPDYGDLMIYRGLAQEMSDLNNFNFGTGYETIGYTVNGDAVDWTYGNNGIITYTPEVGSSSQGFWPSESDVEELCDNQFGPNKVFAFTAGSDFVLGSYDFSNDLLPGALAFANLEILNRGLASSSGAVSIKIEPLSQLISIENQLVEIGELNSWQKDTISFELNVSDQVAYFSEASIKISIQDEKSFNYKDTLRFFIGNQTLLYQEDFNSGIGQWSVDGDWGLTNEPSIGLYALTDSPNGNYSAEISSSATLEIDLDFSFIANPFVSYSALWDIEDGYDFVRFQAYTEEDGWLSLMGNYTVQGNGATAQPLGQYGYDGSQSSWVIEKIYLNQLNGNKPLAFRFIQDSDQYVEGDGFVFDDFSINGFSLGLLGDQTSDGTVNIFDIIGVADMISRGEEPSNYELTFCDLDDNGEINILDLLMIINLVSN
jgi:carboxypeptidase T